MFSLPVSIKFLAMRNITVYSVHNDQKMFICKLLLVFDNMKSAKVIVFLSLCFSNLCESKSCFDEGITWSSDGLLSFIPQILSTEECIKLCLEQDNCNGYTWHGQYNERLRLGKKIWYGFFKMGRALPLLRYWQKKFLLSYVRYLFAILNRHSSLPLTSILELWTENCVTI